MGLFKYISSKRKTRENLGLQLNEVGDPVTEDTEKAELINATFASVFIAKTGPKEFQYLELGFTLGNVVGMYLAQNYDIPNIAKKLEEFKKDVEAKKKPPSDKS
ncbi:PREDICTED: uncharacterized protein C7orf73 homolog [Buceros rhinoceros silvestris]|uniref:uncharacterized protein C7orf73 homolog n=1 Tax=Buceros rhinoceros silvestris TaxID=175836 RepID=UPI000528FB62|nr:PREDICTED: uncharacterized protein C7orf73 homolog [Buceros rhinoceros silvestris]